jgi:type II secretory pathway component PulJ
LTLLEVLLSLGILATVLIAVSPIVDSGMRTAVRSEGELRALLECQSRLNRMAAGLDPVVTISGSKCENHPDLKCDVQVAPASTPGLSHVTVTVTWQAGDAVGAVPVTLHRWMRSAPPHDSRPSIDLKSEGMRS